jgi:hypothetical protein
MSDPSFGFSWRAGSARKLLSLQDLEKMRPGKVHGGQQNVKAVLLSAASPASVIPGRIQWVRAERGPMDANPESYCL